MKQLTDYIKNNKQFSRLDNFLLFMSNHFKGIESGKTYIEYLQNVNVHYSENEILEFTLGSKEFVIKIEQ